MKIEKLLIKLLTLLTLSLNASLVWAIEDVEPDTSPYWPLIVLFALLIIFRKKLIAEATVENHGEHKAHAEDSVDKKAPQKVENKPIENDSEAVTDLTHHVEQCQGTTSKGARCSRTTNLEPVVVSIDDKQYKFLTCKQHHTDRFTPFHFR